MMVISFLCGEARNQLLSRGIVYTFRWKRRSFFEKRLGTREYTWANSGRGKTSLAYVWIEEVGSFMPTAELRPYVSQSGFNNLWDWQEAISEMGGGTKGWLYKVSLASDNKESGVYTNDL